MCRGGGLSPGVPSDRCHPKTLSRAAPRRSALSIRPRAAAGGDDRGAADPILNASLRDPVAFFGGVFAGLLALDLSQGTPTASELQTAQREAAASSLAPHS